MIRLTIFTPTYNRRDQLERCYLGMKSQKNSDFIWLIVDDGSTDNTKELVDKWKKGSDSFEIEYI